jgi:hypothetical protein
MNSHSLTNLALTVAVLALSANLGCSSGSGAAPAPATAGSAGAGGAGGTSTAGGASSAGAPSVDFSNIPANAYGDGVSGISDGKPFTYYPALENGAVGDYQGTGSYVAQITPVVAGGYQADLLHAFAVPSDMPVAVLNGTAAGESVMFSGAGWSGVLSGGHFTGQNGSDSFDLSYLEHASPTLGEAAPAGAVVLFDGSNLDAWAKKDATNWLQQAGPAPWLLVDGGAVEVVPGSDGIITKQLFGDFTLHLEYRTLGSPTNSGVLLEARYESNINETYGLYSKAPGGGFDNCTPATAKLQTRAARPPLAWQTLDIVFTAPRFDTSNTKTASASATVDLNGVRVYDKMQLDPPTGAAQRLGEAPTGPLMLQEHGMKLQFRNIWLVEATQ